MQTVYKYKIIFFYSFKGNNIETPWNNPTRLDLPRVIPYHQARSLTIISPRPVRHEFNQKKEKNNKISVAQFPEKRQSGQIARVSSRFNGQRKDRKVEKLHSSRPPVESVRVQPPTNWDHRGKFRLGDARWGEVRHDAVQTSKYPLAWTPWFDDLTVSRSAETHLNTSVRDESERKKRRRGEEGTDRLTGQTITTRWKIMNERELCVWLFFW